MCECVYVCVCVLVLYLILNVCVAGSLQQRLHHVSMPVHDRHVHRRVSILQGGGVSRQSGARMLHCYPYRESNTQAEGRKNQGARFTQPSPYTHTNTHARNMSFRQKNTSNTHTVTSFRRSVWFAGAEGRIHCTR